MTTDRDSTRNPRDMHGPPEQLALPFLTAADVAKLDRAAVAIQRATEHAVAGGRLIEAQAFTEVGRDLLDIIARNAERNRAAR